MKKINIITVLCTLLVSINLNAQSDSLFIHLDRSEITSGILLESGLDSLYQLYDYTGENTTFSNKWTNLHHLFRIRQFEGDTIPHRHQLQKMHREYEGQWLEKNRLVRPVYIHRYDYHYMKPYAIDSNLVTLEDGKFYDVEGREESPYLEGTAAFSGVYNTQEPNANKISLLFKKEFFVTNTDEELINVTIDADDGNGFVAVSLDEPYAIRYRDAGHKKIQLRFTTTSGEYLSGFEIKVGNTHLCEIESLADCPDPAPWETKTPEEWVEVSSGQFDVESFGGDCVTEGSWLIEADIPYQGRKAMGNAYVKYAYGSNELTKPFIMVEGIDFSSAEHSDLFDFGYYRSLLQHGDAGWCQIINGGNNYVDAYNAQNDDREERDWYGPIMYHYPETVHQLRQAGYDIIMLDFWDAADYIQRNAFLLVKLIELVNEHKVDDAHPTAIAAASMGGQVSRYALNWMEDNDRNHCSNVWISLDSPHQGANIPAGIQYMLHFLSEQTLGDTGENARNQIDNSINRPAARQMVSYQVSEMLDEDLTDAWYGELNSMGYPQDTWNVGIANGSRNGVGQDTPSSELTFEVNSAAVSLSTWSSPGIYNSSLDKGKVFSGRVFPMGTSDFYISTDIGEIDGAPGGFRTTYEQLGFSFSQEMNESNIEVHYNDHNFVSTISALDIDTDDLFFSFENISLPQQKLTPFNSVFSAEGSNEQHSEITPQSLGFMLEQLRAAEYHLPKVLTASSPNNGVYNVAQPAHKFIGDVQIEQGGRLYVNANKEEKFGSSWQSWANFTPAGGSLLEVSIGSPCLGETVSINDNGAFILGEASPNNRAEVRVSEGSRLILNEGGQLIIHDNSTLRIEEGARFLYYGGEIIFEGPNSVLEIAGELEIEEDRILSLNIPSGLIRFVNGAVVKGDNARFQLSSVATRKVIDLVGGTGATPRLDESLRLVQFTNLGVASHDNGRLMIESNRAVLSRVHGKGFTNNASITLAGHKNQIANQSVFDQMTINCLNLEDGSTTITESEFKNSGTAVRFSGNGTFTIREARVHNNEAGILAASAQNVGIEDCFIHHNRFGVETFLSVGTHVSIDDSRIRDNEYGVYTLNGELDQTSAGTGSISMNCGDVSNNEVGIMLANYANLSLDNHDGSGRVTFRDNETFAIFAHHANWIFMDEGENNFRHTNYFEEKCEVETLGGGHELIPGDRPDLVGEVQPGIAGGTVTTCHPLVYGTLCGLEEGQGTTLDATKNYWPDIDEPGHPNSGQYAIDLYQGCRAAGAGTYEEPGVAPAMDVQTIPESQTISSCETIHPDPICCIPLTEIRCHECVHIVTEAFKNVRLNRALRLSLEEAHEGVGNSDTEQVFRAIEWMNQILSYPYEQLNETENRILDVTHRQLQKTVREYVSMDTLGVSQTQKDRALKIALGQIRQKEQRAESENNYRELVSSTFERAQHYRLTNQRDESLQILQEMTAWVDPSDIDQVNRFICLVERELAVLEGSMSSEDFFEGLVEECKLMNADDIEGKSSSWLTYQEKDKSTKENSLFEVFVYPNPSKDVVNISFTGDESVQSIKVINPVGSQMYSSSLKSQEHSFDVSTWEKGMYFIVLGNTEGEVITVKKITVM